MGGYYVTKQLLYLSGQNEWGANKNNESGKAYVKTKEYVWRQNKDYVPFVASIKTLNNR